MSGCAIQRADLQAGFSHAEKIQKFLRERVTKPEGHSSIYMSRTGEPERRECMNNRRIWFRLGGVLAAAAVCTGGAAVVSDRAQEAKNVQRAVLGAMETQMQIGCYPSETGSPIRSRDFRWSCRSIGIPSLRL